MIMEQYIKAFVNVSKRSFLEFAGVEAAEGRPCFIDSESLAQWDISSIISLSGDTQGAVAVSMGKEPALKLANILTGDEHSAVDDDVTGAVAEIVNLIAGKVKRDLEDTLRPVISLPIITQSGQSVAEWFGTRPHIICVPFTIFDNMTFILSVFIEAAERQG